MAPKGEMAMVLTKRIQTIIFGLWLGIVLIGNAFGDTIFWCVDKEGIKKLRNYPCGHGEQEMKRMSFIHIRNEEQTSNKSPQIATTANAQQLRAQAQYEYDIATRDDIIRRTEALAAKYPGQGGRILAAGIAAASGNPDNATARYNAALGAIPQQESPPPTAPRSAINTQTGEFYPGVAGGIINPRNGRFYPEVAGGYINSTTGQFIPAQ